MPIENLAAGVKSLKSEFDRTNTKREHWNTNTMPLLQQTFEAIVAKYGLDWNFMTFTDKVNAGGVNLSFGKSVSGVLEKTETGQKALMKTGGTLAFSQAYNGDVLVQIFYPTVEKLMKNEQEQQLLHRIHPEKIDEEMIYLQVSKFLTEMIAWESATNDKTGTN